MKCTASPDALHTLRAIKWYVRLRLTLLSTAHSRIETRYSYCLVSLIVAVPFEGQFGIKRDSQVSAIIDGKGHLHLFSSASLTIRSHYTSMIAGMVLLPYTLTFTFGVL